MMMMIMMTVDDDAGTSRWGPAHLEYLWAWCVCEAIKRTWPPGVSGQLGNSGPGTGEPQSLETSEPRILGCTDTWNLEK